MNWVKAPQKSKNKHERLSLKLQIAYYDYVVAGKFGYDKGKKKARAKISHLRSRLKYMTLADELKAYRTSHKNQKKQIEYDKKLGVTFSEEVRNDKKYLYKQKRGTRHEYVAKDWDDLDTKQKHRAGKEVFQDHWALMGLSPSEIETFHLIEKELPKIQTQEFRDLAHRKFLKSLSEEEEELIEMEAERIFIEMYEHKVQRHTEDINLAHCDYCIEEMLMSFYYSKFILAHSF